jgi:guanidinobutyrase
MARIRDTIGDTPCYLSFDIDGIDPAYAGGTGTPEIGGLRCRRRWRSFAAAMG